MDKQKEICSNESGVGDCKCREPKSIGKESSAGREIPISPKTRAGVDGQILQQLSGIGCREISIGAGSEMDSPTGPKDRSVRETLKWMSSKNADIMELIDKFKLEII